MQEWIDKRYIRACCDVAVFSRDWMKRLVIALDSSSLQPSPVDDRTACQIVPGPLDPGLLRVSLSLSLCAQECVCALVGVHRCTDVCVNLLSKLYLLCAYFLDTVCASVQYELPICVCSCPVHSGMLWSGLPSKWQTGQWRLRRDKPSH